MDIFFLTFIILMGLPVMHSYYVASQSNHFGRLVGFKGLSLWLWGASTIVTIACYFTYVVRLLTAHDTVEPQHYLTFGYFTSSASGWVGYSLIALREVRLRWHVFLNLLLTAIASMFMLAYGIVDNDMWLIASGSWLVVHHLVVDAFLWTRLWFSQIQQRVEVPSEPAVDQEEASVSKKYGKVIF